MSHREITACVYFIDKNFQTAIKASKCLCHCIKEINAIFPLALSVIDYRGRQNVVRRPLTQCATFLFMMSSVIYN